MHESGRKVTAAPVGCVVDEDVAGARRRNDLPVDRRIAGDGED